MSSTDVSTCTDMKQLADMLSKTEITEEKEKIEKRINELKQTKSGAGRGRGAPTGAKGAMNAFKSMDKAACPAGAKPNFLGAPRAAAKGGAGINRSPSAIKQMLLDWCKAMTKDYKGVNIVNFGSSWSDGLAFCALIHKFYPDAFDFDSLKPENRRANFTLAFETAEKCADISQILEVEDMVRMKTPDWKCVFTYIQFYYRKFHNFHAAPAASSEKEENEKEEQE